MKQLCLRQNCTVRSCLAFYRAKGRRFLMFVFTLLVTVHELSFWGKTMKCKFVSTRKYKQKRKEYKTCTFCKHTIKKDNTHEMIKTASVCAE